jgi:omega-amidase
MLPKLRIALCQISVGAVKAANIASAESAVKLAVESTGSNLIVLPECWNSPYNTACFPEYSEVLPAVGETSMNGTASPSAFALCSLAKDLKIWLVGGSVPERELDVTSAGKDKIFNTCLVVNPEGIVVGKHRKVHLFDIDVPGKITFKESDSLTGGSTCTVVDTPWGGLGIGICYDIRFPELGILMRKMGAKVLVYPGAFNMTTGPAHWELLQRARAVDNQCYVAACSPARDTTSGGYVAYGHSSVVNPWGEVVATMEEGEGIVSTDIDLARIDEIRQNIPCWNQKRTDLYELVAK